MRRQIISQDGFLPLFQAPRAGGPAVGFHSRDAGRRCQVRVFFTGFRQRVLEVQIWLEREKFIFYKVYMEISRFSLFLGTYDSINFENKLIFIHAIKGSTVTNKTGDK